MRNINYSNTKKRSRYDRSSSPWIVHVFFVLICLACVLPMLLVTSASFTSTEELGRRGFSLLPEKIDFTAYAYLFENPSEIIAAYGVTTFITIIGTFLSVLIMAMAAYALSRNEFKLRKITTMFIFFPMLFSGGLVASYIVNTQYLNLTDNIGVLILPSLVNVFHIIMLRTSIKDLPEELFDAAKIDGASEWRICFQIAMPLIKPVLATVAFLGALGRWNEWYNAMLYIRNPDKYPLQYLLQRMMMNIQELLNNMGKIPTIVSTQELPGENLRMALLIVCVGPMMLFFPFFQKYFVKGMTIGSVKG